MSKKILLKIKNITKTYNSVPAIHALKGVSLDIYDNSGKPPEYITPIGWWNAQNYI